MIKIYDINKPIQRCPWCGTEDGRGNHFKWNYSVRISNINWDNCLNCGKYYKTKCTWHYFVSSALGMLSLYCGLFNFSIMILLLIISTILFSISASNSPYMRVSKGKWYERVYPYPKPQSAKATFHWLTKKESGVFLINYIVQEDVILPICFIDKNNQPTSQTWCVSFENIKRKGKYKMEAEIHFLLEEAPNTLLESGNRFLVFGHTSRIGVGEIHERILQKGTGKQHRC